MMQNASPRKADILANSERAAAQREEFWKRAAFFHEEDLRYLRFLIPEGLRVLELGCGTGNVLAGLKPSYGLGIDFSTAMIVQAKRLHPNMHFQGGNSEDRDFIGSFPGLFDFILFVETGGALDKIQATFETLHRLCT